MGINTNYRRIKDMTTLGMAEFLVELMTENDGKNLGRYKYIKEVDEHETLHIGTKPTYSEAVIAMSNWLGKEAEF